MHPRNVQYYTRYLVIDSKQRKKEATNIYDEELFSPPPYPIRFTHGSSIITIQMPRHPLKRDDKVTLTNVISKNVILHNPLQVKKNSRFIKVHHPHHGLSLYGLYQTTNAEAFSLVEYVDDLPSSFREEDQILDGKKYYVLKINATANLAIQVSGVQGSNVLRTTIGNIPVNYINRKHTVYLLFTRVNGQFQLDTDNYLIMLEKRSLINYRDGLFTNNVYIKYLNLFGVPINYLNSGLPLGEDKRSPYLTVINTTTDTIQIDTGFPAIVDPQHSFYHYQDIMDVDIDINTLVNSSHGGGNHIYLKRVVESIPGYPNPNQYAIPLDRVYQNVVQARLVGSTFPNSQRVITTDNNRLYWRNLDDGDWIYFLEVTPGNYSPEELKKEIENKFSRTIRYQYTKEFSERNVPKIVEQKTPLTNDLYDEWGLYQYHTVQLDISTQTDLVTFTFYRELKLSDQMNEPPILIVHDRCLEITMAENLRSNFGRTGINLVPTETLPFSPEMGEMLYLYLTPNSHARINLSFHHAYYQIYRYRDHLHHSDGFNTFWVEEEVERSFLFNFLRFDNLTEARQEIRSINTTTILRHFQYYHLTHTVYLENHQLRVRDLIITDQFINPYGAAMLAIYEITNIIDENSLTVSQVPFGHSYKFIYDNLLINFSADPKDARDACHPLDQIKSSEEIQSLPLFPNCHNTLSLTSINVPSVGRRLQVRHIHHQLSVHQEIIISGSLDVNTVPAAIINRRHRIHRIIDDDHYEILLPDYHPVPINSSLNSVQIRYPELSQMFFYFTNTLGEILGFHHVGEPRAITPYQHTIKNTDPYLYEHKDYPAKKLNMTGDNYFNIVCPELATYDQANVPQVFSQIRWFECPGNVVFDSFVPSITIFHPPLPRLTELHFSMVRPNGKLVEFNGEDHSFVIEFIELYFQPGGTNISSNLNAEITS